MIISKEEIKLTERLQMTHFPKPVLYLDYSFVQIAFIEKENIFSKDKLSDIHERILTLDVNKEVLYRILFKPPSCKHK